jgi:thioredoxin 1
MNFKLQWIKGFVFLLLLQIPQVGLEAGGNKSNPAAFHKISLTTAKQKAAEENKYIFVEFYADWCVPCKWMEETTFADGQVQNELANNFVALRVDIDDFDGFALKQHYNIRVLPTIMILDENGRTVVREEQSLTAPMLLQILEAQPERQVELPVNSSPVNATTSKEKIEKNKDDEPPLPIVQPTNINHATVKTNTYRVQVGVFTDYANTEKLVQELRTYTEEPIIVLNDYLNNRTVFKVMVGDFDSKKDALNFKNQLWQNYGIDGFVK